MKEEYELSYRRGWVKLNTNYLLALDETFLHAFFSNFYPISITEDTYEDFTPMRKFYGVSPFFEKLGEDERVPEYEVILTSKHRGLNIDFKKK